MLPLSGEWAFGDITVGDEMISSPALAVGLLPRGRCADDAPAQAEARTAACTGRDITVGDDEVISPPALAVGLLSRGRCADDAPVQAGARTAAYTGRDITVGDEVISPPALAVGLLPRGPRQG